MLFRLRIVSPFLTNENDYDDVIMKTVFPLKKREAVILYPRNNAYCQINKTTTQKARKARSPGPGLPVARAKRWARGLLRAIKWSNTEPLTNLSLKNLQFFRSLYISSSILSKRGSFYLMAPSLKTPCLPCRGPRVSTISFWFSASMFWFFIRRSKTADLVWMGCLAAQVLLDFSLSSYSNP